MLEEHIASDVSAGKSVDVTTLFGWFGFDVMGDFVFGDAFEMSEEWHSVTLTLREALNLLGPLSPVPWLVHFGFNMAGFLPSIKNWFAMIAWCRRQMENRAKVVIQFPSKLFSISVYADMHAAHQGRQQRQ